MGCPSGANNGVKPNTMYSDVGLRRKLHPAYSFHYSSVHCHIKPASQNKGTSLIQVLSNNFPQYSPEQVVTVGDSPNDASLFNPELFPLSVGVANILDYANELSYQPAYVTTAAEGEGFCELVRGILSN